MKQQIGIRIRVVEPPKGVATHVQSGKCVLLPPAKTSAKGLVFEFPVDVDVSSGIPNFLGAFAQGPNDARFIYVNTGTYAGDADSEFGRRAKISLMSITREQVDEALGSKGAKLETSYPGTDKKGGPTCASVKGLVWRVVKK